jgi:CBS domain-containing protein
VIGIVGEGDVFLNEGDMSHSTIIFPVFITEWAYPASPAECYGDDSGYTAADIMICGVVCADVEDPIRSVALLMVQHHLKSIPVLRNGKLQRFPRRLSYQQGVQGDAPRKALSPLPRSGRGVGGEGKSADSSSIILKNALVGIISRIDPVRSLMKEDLSGQREYAR